ncbi:hypothetical protein K474DRAFT_688261 [Panus rudis PR-1116 ss-1]|nr:hypothetical protein K474DRAFT_688261 [Panus rudis PR-1116 ss-1]
MPDIIPEDEVLDNALHERENTIDIESVATEAAAQLSSIVDYAVDEVASEGRRTVEPETGPSDAQADVQEVLSQDSSLPVVETNGEDGSSQQSTTHPILSQAETLVAAEEGKTRKAWVMDVPDESELSIMVGEPVNDVLEYAVEDPSVSSPEYTVEEPYDSAAPSQYTVEEPSDEDSPKVETAPSIPKEDEADVEALPVISVAEEGDVATPEDAVPATKGESVPPELESGVPMPVSADPDVPDPTSIVGTPGTSTPGSDADAGITSGTAGHLFPANLLKTTATRSGSGLFTPLYDGVISPASSDNPVNTGTASSVDGGAELEQAPSEPPASQVPDINEKPAVPNLEAEETLPHPQTQANALSIHPQEDLFATPVENTADSKDAEVHDIDADGDIDSDYEQPVEDLRSTPELSTANVSQAAEPSEQADIVTPADSPSNTLAPEDATVEGAVNEDVIEETTPEPSRLKDTDEAMRAMPPPKQVSETEDAKEAATNQEDKSEERDEIRPLKRKRTPSPAAPRLTRSMSMGRSRIPLPTRSRKGKGKEKAKANEQSSEDDRDESNSVTSSLGAEALLLADHTQSKSSTPMSRGTSRASSVLSSVASGPSELSPIEHLERPQPPPRSLSDIQALLRHHHGNASRPLLLQREPSRREPPCQEPLPQESPAVPVKPNSSVNTPAATPLPQAESSGNTDEAATNIGLLLPVAASTSTITFSPRVGTRSNCRYHKISLPGEGDRPRIFFLVPACSLSNIEFMKEEDIQDHGLATEEDGRNMLYDIDIESLGISLYLVGTLRQLVGVDLIREREVFYLPQAGEFIKESTKRKSRRRQSHRDSISSRTIAGTNLSTATATQRIPGASRCPAKAPRSKADSISTVGSSIPWGSQRYDGRSESVSASISMQSMSDNEEEKPAKRRRGPKAKNAEASGSAAPSSTAPHNTPSNGASTSKDADTKPKVRRSRRLGTDAAAYKPEENPSETSENEAPSRRVANRKGGAIRGTKRGRTVEEKPGDDGAQASKRRKVHVRTASSLPVKKKK